MQPNNPSWLVIFTFSPVQGFISSAKKTKDLFAGSYLLSFLTKMVLTKLKKSPPKKELITVYPIVQENNKDLHSLTVGNYPNRFVVLIKNQPREKIEKILKNLKGYFYEEINELAQKTCNVFVTKNLVGSDQCPQKLQNLPFLLRAVEQIVDHIGDYFSAFAVAKEVELEEDPNGNYKIKNYKGEYELTEKLLGGRKTFRPYNGKVDRATVDDKFPDGCTTCGERLHLAIDWSLGPIEGVAENEKLCGLCYAKRNLFEVYLSHKLQEELKDIPKKYDFFQDLKLLMTRFPSTHDIALAREKLEFFKTFKDVFRCKDCKENFVNFLRILFAIKYKFNDEGVNSYGINYFYREQLDKIFKEICDYLGITTEEINSLKEEIKEELDMKHRKFEWENNIWDISVEFLSTNFIENFLKELSQNPEEQDRKKIELLEEWLEVLKTYYGAVKELFPQKDFEKEFNKAPYFAIIYSDGDNIGKILGGDKEFLPQCKEFTLQFHKEFSQKLSEYATQTAKEIEQPESSPERVGFAKVIYAGGDDIFAFLHGSEVIRTLKICSVNYGKKLKGVLREGKATTSAGVVLGHAKVSLKFLYKKTKEAESRAKNLFGRNAFVIKVISRSGEESEFGAKYIYGQYSTERIQTLDLLEELTKYCADGYISSKLPYALREIALKALTHIDEAELQKEIALRLIKRELRRKVNLPKEDKERLIEKLLRFFNAQIDEHTKERNCQKPALTVGDIVKNLAGMLYVARRLADFYGGTDDADRD
jgi:CRISPR-associated protein Cmr2